MKEVLLSGSSDKEYSYDASIGGTFHGAMTYHAIKVIEGAGYRLTYADLHTQLQPMLDEAGYPQHPQLEGKDENKARQIFTWGADSAAPTFRACGLSFARPSEPAASLPPGDGALAPGTCQDAGQRTASAPRA